MSADPVLDPESIEALKAVSPDDGGAFFRELIDIFLSDTPQRLREIRTSLAAADASTLMRAAHSIKGSAGNFGARRFARVAQQIESHAKNSDLTRASTLVTALEEEFARVKSAMEQLRGATH